MKLNRTKSRQVQLPSHEASPADSADDVYALPAGQHKSTTFYQYYRKWPMLRVLIGCSVAWFCLDVGFYGVNLNQSLTLQAIGFTKKG